jgi:hypothetical protein
MTKLLAALVVPLMLAAPAHADPDTDILICNELRLGVPIGVIAEQLHDGAPSTTRQQAFTSHPLFPHALQFGLFRAQIPQHALPIQLHNSLTA